MLEGNPSVVTEPVDKKDKPVRSTKHEEHAQWQTKKVLKIKYVVYYQLLMVLPSTNQGVVFTRSMYLHSHFVHILQQ